LSKIFGDGGAEKFKPQRRREKTEAWQDRIMWERKL